VTIDDPTSAEEDRAQTLVIQVELNPSAAKIVDHLCSERLRIIAAEIGQHPPVHTRRVLDEHVSELTGFRAELKRAMANPVTVPVPNAGGGE
jgi:hypothetical protein